VTSKFKGEIVALLSDEHEHAFNMRRGISNLPSNITVKKLGKTEKERRENFATAFPYCCGFFMQGGPYTADEMCRLTEKNIPLVLHIGSGGAAGGLFVNENNNKEAAEIIKNQIEETKCDKLITSSNPDEDAVVTSWTISSRLMENWKETE